MIDDELRDETLEIMARRNIVGVVSGSEDRVAEWRRLAPDRVISGLVMAIGRDDGSRPTTFDACTLRAGSRCSAKS